MFRELNKSGPGKSSNVATSSLSKRQSASGIEVSAMFTANKMPRQGTISLPPSPSRNNLMMQPQVSPVISRTAANPSTPINQLSSNSLYLQNVEHDHSYCRQVQSTTPPMDDDDECQIVAVVPRTPAVNSMNKAPSLTMSTPESDGPTDSRIQEQEISDKTRAEQVLAVQSYHKNSVTAKDFPTFAEPATPYGSKRVKSVDARLPSHEYEKYQYGVPVDEIKRRVGAPEYMNQSSLMSFLRTTKRVMENTLDLHNIEVKSQESQKELNSFSSLFEKEAQELAEDLDTLDSEYFPNLELARQTIRNLLAKGYDIAGCLRALNNTSVKIEAIVKSLETRQPKVTGMEEKLKGNFLDVPYHEFSVSTHGFGHPSSLSHYRSYLTVIRTAIYQCEQVKEGTPLEPIERVIPGVKPFQYMSDEYYAKLQSSQQEEDSEIAENQQITEGTENQPNQQSQNTTFSSPPHKQHNKNQESLSIQ